MSHELQSALIYGFIDGSIEAVESFKPKLLVNDNNRGEKVLTSLISELRTCDSFYMSVAFVTCSGVTVLLSVLQELMDRGVTGTLIASQYQNFTEPKALQQLMHFHNIELRIVTEDQSRMHTKGYLFRKGNKYSVIVGSSNLTQNALCENQEWNLRVSATHDGALVQQVLNEFQEIHKLSIPVTNEWLKVYRDIYEVNRKAVNSANSAAEKRILQFTTVPPNKMQTAALSALEKLRSMGAQRALIISATGTGKTYLSAFDVRVFKPKRFLFIVHREIIAKDAMKSFKKAIGYDINMSVMSHGNRVDADYIFAMVQTMSKDNILYSYSSDYFDYIVFDEVHRAGANSYQKILEHFKPKFLLGMSATPERSDGFDIFKLFDYNIAYEIRLQQAMKEDMICPFHYFGISELTINGLAIDDKTEFRQLTSDERVRNIIQQAEFYGYSGNRLKGLIFVSRTEEAQELSNKFNATGKYRTCALIGASTPDERESAIRRLEHDEYDGGLDYIITVDIFNEGVDIPSVNQVIMLRPTESAIIFVQQLGRGLRKKEYKEFLVVIDFIGNYENNFLIPIALSGDQTYNKDTIRRYVAEGSSIIPGCSTVNFDKVTRERIFASIDRANFNDVKLIKEKYLALKQRIGHIPSLTEFAQSGSIDYCRVIDKYKSYYTFLDKCEREYTDRLSETEAQFLEFVSTKYANGKRPHELEYVKLIITNSYDPWGDFFGVMEEKYPKIKLTDQTRICIENQMIQDFVSGSARTTYAAIPFIHREENGNIVRSKVFSDALHSKLFCELLNELIDVALARNASMYSDRYQDTSFVLYQKYTYEDVCRCLDWDRGEVALNIGGYKFHCNTKTYPVFINYEKDDDISATTKYEDRFISPSILIAISKSGRTVSSDDVQQALHARENGVDLCLFVRKNKDDSIIGFYSANEAFSIIENAAVAGIPFPKGLLALLERYRDTRDSGEGKVGP